MALKEVKIQRLISDWKTGTFTEVALSKKYKVSRTTVRKYCTVQNKGTNTNLVEAMTIVEDQKQTKSVHEIRAAEEASKRLTKHQQQKDSIVDLALSGTQKNLAFATVQAGTKDTVPSDRASLQRVFKTGLDMVTPKEDKGIVVENNLQVAQLMHEEKIEMTITNTPISDMDDEELSQAFKNRGLPI